MHLSVVAGPTTLCTLVDRAGTQPHCLVLIDVDPLVLGTTSCVATCGPLMDRDMPLMGGCVAWRLLAAGGPLMDRECPSAKRLEGVYRNGTC